MAAYQNVVSQAQTAAATPYKAYTGELTAGTNAEEGAAQNTINGLSGTANGYYNTASQQGTLGSAAVNPTAVNGAAIQQYESPYENQVIQATQAQIANTDAQQSQQQTSNAIGAGAFGGDRAGVAQAALAGQQAIANNATLASLNNQNYSQALGEANTQQATTLGADQANRTAIQNNASLQAGLGSAATTSGLGIASGQLSSGALSQQTQQAADTANYGQFENQQAYPFQTTQYLANVVEGIEPNTGTTTSGTATQSAPSSLNSIIGGGLGLAGLFSDERVKEDIKPIGKTYDGQTMYSFKYKGDHTTRVGLMAQDVEKKHPHAVGSLGGIKTVDYDKATSAAASRGHFASGGGVTDAIAKLRAEMDRLSGAGRTQTSPSQTASRSASANGSQKEFADRVKDVSSKISTHPFKDRAAISQVYDAYGKVHPDAGSLSSFKERLAGAAKQQHLTLSRVDLPERMDRDTRERSESPYGSDSVHYVNHDKSRYAFGGVVPGGMGSQPYGGSTTGYVPLASGQLPSAHTQQPNLNLTQGLGATQTGATMQSPGMQNMMAGAKLFSNSDAGQSMKNSIQDFGQDFAADPASTLGFNRGGNVVGLGAARMRRHYDGGGTVPDADAMVFDPTALATGTDGGATFQPGFSGSTAPSGFLPPPSQGPAAAVMSPVAPAAFNDPSTWSTQALGAAAGPTAPQAPGGLGAATTLPTANDNAPSDPASSASSAGLGAAATPANASRPTALGAINTASPASGQVGSGFNGAVGFTMKQEGGYNPSDSNGSPSNFGINQAANPDVDVSKLTPDQAKALYKTRYWDAIGGDSLPPALQKVAFDTSVIAGPGKAKELLAQSGGDPNKFMDLRQNFLDGLVAANPQKYGQYAKTWSDRDAALRADINGGGTPSDALGYSAQAGANAASGTLGSAGSTGGLGAAANGTGSWTDNFGSLIGGTGKPSADHSGGILGLFPGMSDEARQGLMSAGFGMMASPSRNWGMALGQGAQQGLATYQTAQKLQNESTKTRAQVQNIGSEIATRAGTLGLEGRKQDLAEKQAQRIIDAASAASKALSANSATNLQQPVAAGSSGPTPSATGAPVALTGSTPSTPSSATNAPSGPSSSMDWSKVAPQSNPAWLDAKADNLEKASIAAAASPETQKQYNDMAMRYRQAAAQVRQTGKVTMTDGSVQLVPGFTDAEAGIESAKTNARAQTEAGYKVREAQPVAGGPTTYTTDAAILGKGTSASGGVGAGSPPGSNVTPSSPTIAQQPAFYAKKQEAIATGEQEMVGQFQARQVARQRLQDLQNILQTYQTGAFSEEKADLAAKLSAAGIPVSKGSLDNAANFQKFTKDATANLFDQVKGMGGRVLVSEIEGLKNANANADLQPSANASIIGQGLGLLNYEDKHTNDYFAWKKANPNATDTSEFELPWAKANPVAPFVNAARQDTAAKGIVVPAAPDRVAGQAYMTPKGKAVWTGAGWKVAQ